MGGWVGYLPVVSVPVLSNTTAVTSQAAWVGGWVDEWDKDGVNEWVSGWVGGWNE